ncbi:Uncharacterized protein PBTT_09353 [Plasmodiophora brassicae]
MSSILPPLLILLLSGRSDAQSRRPSTTITRRWHTITVAPAAASSNATAGTIAVAVGCLVLLVLLFVVVARLFVLVCRRVPSRPMAPRTHPKALTRTVSDRTVDTEIDTVLRKTARDLLNVMPTSTWPPSRPDQAHSQVFEPPSSTMNAHNWT